MQMTQESATQRLAALGMDDMPIISHRPTPTQIPNDWFARYKELCRKFTMTLTDSVEELFMLNIPQDDFMALIMGRHVPENLSFRLRIPLAWGGKLEIDNMFMCRTFPHSHNLDRFIIEQSGADTIWLPNPAKKVYTSVHTAGGGDGGNATEDRLSQMAAQIASGKSME